MTSDKDFKKLVRSRMEKTGESYTAARASLLQKDRTASAATDELERLRREAEQYGARVIHEASGRWAARADNGMVEYGSTEAEAYERLIDAIWQYEMDWRNNVDDDTAFYLENQSDD
ncbi:hypothetical protein [Sorangium sp. So ce233]|uniref:hypothetical protein n=1 Tax=Sorangium sp. So ce233 TaxID=3133290 RepID=UPI003F5F85CC